jgi:hypothetical protein
MVDSPFADVAVCCHAQFLPHEEDAIKLFQIRPIHHPPVGTFDWGTGVRNTRVHSYFLYVHMVLFLLHSRLQVKSYYRYDTWCIVRLFSLMLWFLLVNHCTRYNSITLYCNYMYILSGTGVPGTISEGRSLVRFRLQPHYS